MANSGARRCLTVAVKQAGRRSNGGTETVEVSSRGAERNGIAGGTLGHGRCKTPRRVSNHGARWSRCRAGTSECLGRLGGGSDPLEISTCLALVRPQLRCPSPSYTQRRRADASHTTAADPRDSPTCASAATSTSGRATAHQNSAEYHSSGPVPEGPPRWVRTRGRAAAGPPQPLGGCDIDSRQQFATRDSNTAPVRLP